MKYKIGEEVIIKNYMDIVNLNLRKTYSKIYFNPDMQEFCGRVVEVVDIKWLSEKGVWVYELGLTEDNDPLEWVWDEDWLDVAPEPTYMNNRRIDSEGIDL